jgi:hypothetical protein
MTQANQPVNSRGRAATVIDSGHPRIRLRNVGHALLAAAGTVLERGGPAAVTALSRSARARWRVRELVRVLAATERRVAATALARP